jgi:ABC-type molybdate transport system substrate-binding protein
LTSRLGAHHAAHDRPINPKKPAAGEETLPEIQQYTIFRAAIGASAAQAEAGKALLKFLKSPDAAKVLKAKGLEPAA